MSDRLAAILSHDSGPFWQFVKYGAIGVLSTLVQVAVFYALAATVLPCLTADDWAVRFLGLSPGEASGAVRGTRFAAATAIGFTVSNGLCWALNRAFVFRPGRFAWYGELALFAGVAGLAMAVGTGVGWALIRLASLMTTLAVALEVVVAFLFNYFMRRFVIFKG